MEVIRPNLCVECGSCVSVCNANAIGMEGTPKLIGKCIACGDCYIVCPRTKTLQDVNTGNEEQLTSIVGDYKEAYACKAKSEEILKKCQDGGAVTAIISSFLRHNGEKAVVAGLDTSRPWFPKPVVTSYENEVVQCAGTKYTSAAMLTGLQDAVKQGAKRIALVGTPCQIQALRRREALDLNKSVNSDYLGIGLFCMETFDYERLMSYLREQGVDPTKVRKFEIKAGKFIARREPDEPFEIKIRKIKDLSRSCCKVCLDYTSEVADISVGNVGSPEGWSTVIVRTEKGQKALKETEKSGLIDVKKLSEFQPGISLVERLSESKKHERKLNDLNK